MTADFVMNKDVKDVHRVVWFSSDLILHLFSVQQLDVHENNMKSPRDIVSLYFRSRCYLAWLQQRLETEHRPDHIRGLEYHRKETERRLDWLKPYVLPALQFIDDVQTRARCVRMVLDFDPAERCGDTYDDPEYPDSTDPYNMVHPYNPELVPVLRDLPNDVSVDVGFCDCSGLVRPSVMRQLPPGCRVLTLPSGVEIADIRDTLLTFAPMP